MPSSTRRRRSTAGSWACAVPHDRGRGRDLPPAVRLPEALPPPSDPRGHARPRGAAMEGAIAWLVKPAMDDIFIKRDLTMLRVLPLLLFGAYLLKGAARYGQSYLMAAIGERVIATLRRALYVHIQMMPLSFFSDRHSADLMSRVITDVNRLARVSSTVLVMAVRQVARVAAL